MVSLAKDQATKEGACFVGVRGCVCRHCGALSVSSFAFEVARGAVQARVDDAVASCKQPVACVCV